MEKRNEFNQHKKRDKVKWIFSTIAFVLIFIALAGVCVQLFAPEGKKLTDKFKKSGAEKTETIPEEPSEDTAAYELRIEL